MFSFELSNKWIILKGINLKNNIILLTGSQPTAENSFVEDNVPEEKQAKDVGTLAQEKLKFSNLIERIFLITLDRGKVMRYGLNFISNFWVFCDR